MIKKILTIALLLPLFCLAQKKNLTYSQTNDIKFVAEYENNTSIDSYKTKDGLIICVGDTLIIGNALINRKKYLFHDVFSHIVVGKTKGSTNNKFRYLPHNYSGSKAVVKSLFVTHEEFTGYKLWPNRKEMPLYVSVFVKDSQSGISKIFSYSRKTILDIEKALSSGEIRNYNAPLSKEEAIAKLKESKDLMELDFLTNEEYEKLREKLTPIILDK